MHFDKYYRKNLIFSRHYDTEPAWIIEKIVKYIDWEYGYYLNTLKNPMWGCWMSGGSSALNLRIDDKPNTNLIHFATIVRFLMTELYQIIYEGVKLSWVSDNNKCNIYLITKK